MKNSITKRDEQMERNHPLIVPYSYSGNTHRIAQETEGHQRRLVYGNLSVAAISNGISELLEQVKRKCKPTTGRDSCRCPYCHISIPLFCGIAQLVRNPCTAFGLWLYQNDLSGKIILPFYSTAVAFQEISRRYFQVVPKADVREALSVIDDRWRRAVETLYKWFAKNCLTESRASRAG